MLLDMSKLLLWICLQEGGGIERAWICQLLYSPVHFNSRSGSLGTAILPHPPAPATLTEP
jgi:hypothetical protein